MCDEPGSRQQPPIHLWLVACLFCVLPLTLTSAPSAQDGDAEVITSADCASCHEASHLGTAYEVDLDHSAHEGFDCLDCHTQKGVVPHTPQDASCWECESCCTCHDQAAEQYQVHGRAALGSTEDMPHCHDCHGDHDILPSAAKRSHTHPVNLPDTCGVCHEDLELTMRHEILIDRPIEIYRGSVHGQATRGGIYLAATCNDCHSTNGSAHEILSPGHPDSTINHFSIPVTCGKCHRAIENDFWEGIHGKLVARGETDAPVCTHCHGEHGILSPDNAASPVSRSRVAEATCSPCHESSVLNEKYGLTSGRLATFIDSYHGLKSKAGDTHVANCASCHGVHRILPSSDPTSTINPANLKTTCGECHPAISVEMAAMPIHGVGGGLRTPAAELVEHIYIIAITVIIGLMVVHWLIDLIRHVRNVIASRPQVQRMQPGEVWQHTFLAGSFTVLVLSGFALRYSNGWIARLMFGWEGGFEMRGTVHRVAAAVLMFTVIWHLLYVTTSHRGHQFLRDMLPASRDFADFWHRILYNLGRRAQPPRFPRFGYVEKAEYWALVWGTVVMISSGLLLWFDNELIQLLPKGVLDVALVIHFWEAWLATLAIGVWHLYSTVFHPQVYPMNPSWLTGDMPEAMYRHEHPEHLEEARRQTASYVQREIDRITPTPSAGDRIEPS